MTDVAPRRVVARRLCFVAGALAAGLLAAELLLRLLWSGEVDTQALHARVAEFELTTIKRFSADPVLYFELLPNRTFSWKTARFVIDADGFRVADHPVEHAADATGAPIRFALIGPSTAFGWRVGFDDCFGEQLRRRLEAAWKRPVELRNFGVPAYNSTQETRLFETKVLEWRPDFVVWNYDHRDAYPVISQDDPIGLPPEYGDNPLHCALLKLALRRLRERALERSRFRGESYTQHDNYLTSGRPYDEHLAALARMAAIASDRHLPVVLFVHDAFIERLPADADHYELLHRPLLERLNRLPGLHVVDLFPRYQAVMQERGWSDLKAWWISVTPQDGHPNPEGHAFIADELARYIQTLPDVGPKR